MGMIQRQDAQCVYVGDDVAFQKGIRAFYHDLSDRIELLQGLWSEANYHTFIAYVHGLKSAARSIGAVSFSAFSEKMEKWAKEKNEKNIEQNMILYLKEAEELQTELKDMIEKTEKERIQTECLLQRQDSFDVQVLKKMCKAADEMDMLEMEQSIDELKKYRYDEKKEKFLGQLIKEEENFEYDEIVRLITSYLDQM